MLAYADALALIKQTIKPGPVIRLPLLEAAGCVLARDVKARLDMPGFDNSAMDGFGIRIADIAGATARKPVDLEISGESRAGGVPPRRIRAGQAVRIFTGAPVPSGVEAIVIQEQCETHDGAVRITAPAKAGENIRRRGEEYRRGVTLFEQGMAATPAVISVLASQGIAELPVRTWPRLAVVASGDELAVPGVRLAPGQIHDSNSPGLISALAELGIKVRGVRVSDTLNDAKRKLAGILDSSDFVLITGGISVGEYDVIRTALTELGVRQIYWQLAVKPGKPNYLGMLSRGGGRQTATYVFGLPGNPVSVLVSYLKLVRPALARYRAADWQPLRLAARLTASLQKQPGRLEWVRGRLEQHKAGLRVTPLPTQGSHMLGGLANANCLIDFPSESSKLAAGSEVMIEVINCGS